ncbi:MAG: hypothetical protein ACOC92_00495 [bacterium]
MERARIADHGHRSAEVRLGGASSSLAGRASEAGYNMVVLMVAVTLLTVFVAASLPLWTQKMKREKEAELISRGWQYAEAIRVFQQRHGRYPTRLKELMRVKPRSIRKLWKDPMTDDGEWGLVFQGDGGPQGGGGQPVEEGGGPGDQGGPVGSDGSGRGSGDAGEAEGSGRGGQGRGGGGLRTPREGEERTGGPIVGVRSRSEEDSIRVLFGEESYDAWHFTVEKLMEAIPEGGRGAFGGGHLGPLTGRLQWVGRPFPQGIEPQQGQGPAGKPLGTGGAGGGAGPRPGPDGRGPGGGRSGRSGGR